MNCATPWSPSCKAALLIPCLPLATTLFSHLLHSRSSHKSFQYLVSSLPHPKFCPQPSSNRRKWYSQVNNESHVSKSSDLSLSSSYLSSEELSTPSLKHTHTHKKQKKTKQTKKTLYFLGFHDTTLSWFPPTSLDTYSHSPLGTPPPCSISEYETTAVSVLIPESYPLHHWHSPLK